MSYSSKEVEHLSSMLSELGFKKELNIVRLFGDRIGAFHVSLVTPLILRGPNVSLSLYFIDCSALHHASNFNFFRVRFCVDGRGAAAGLGLVEDRHDFETESTTRKMQVGKEGKELKGRNCEKVPSPARCALRTSSTVGTT